MRNLPFMERNLRRSRVYGGRMMRFALNRELRHPCCFMHIPKCGGTSLSEALASTVSMKNQIGAIDAIGSRRAAALAEAGIDSTELYHEDGPNCGPLFAFRERQLLYFMSCGMGLVYGHFLFSETAHKCFGEIYRYVTVLRDPVSRVISNYSDAVHGGYIDFDFDAYLGSDVGRRHAQLFLRYFSGIAEAPLESDPAALERAKLTMRHFSIIGFTEDMPEFESQFGDLFGERPRIRHYNSAKREKPVLSARQMRDLRSLCEPDLEIYHFARERR